METGWSFPRRGPSLLAAGMAAAFVLAGCAGGSSGPQPGDEGVAPGASMEEYRAAFEGVEPVTLRIQGDGPEGSLSVRGREAWTDAVTEWSGGAINFEWGYSGSFVPSSTEWAAGLADGRIDVGNFLPYYTPEVFPELTDLTTATFLDGNAPTSTLTGSGWLTEALYTLPQYQEEAEASGVHVLALLPTGNVSGIFCTQPRATLADFAGTSVSASGQGRIAQLTSLGMAPQSIPFTELYEALQRGVVGCGSTVVTAVDSIGATELVPYAVADPEASLVGFPAFIAIGADAWESLPLVGRQLLYDRLDVLLEQDAIYQMERNAVWLEDAQALGGGFRPLAPDARAALLATNEQLLGELAARGVDTDALVGLREGWATRIQDELYADVPTDLDAFLTAGGWENVDLQPYVQAMVDEVLAEHRPA